MAEDKKDELFDFTITIVGKDLDAVERYCRLLSRAGRQYHLSGVSRAPVKKLRITTRKSPCGEGTNSWDHYELRLYKRIFHAEDLTKERAASFVNEVPNPAGIQVTVTMYEK